MKKELQLSALLAALLVYSVYRTVTTFYSIYTYEAGSFVPSFGNVIHWSSILIGIISLTQFYFSEFKKSQLLRLFLIYVVTTLPVDLIQLITSAVSYGNEGSWIFISLLINSVWQVTAFLFLLQLNKHRTPAVVERTGADGASLLHYIPASKGKRFANRLLDVLLLVIISVDWYMWVLLIVVYYYLVVEYLFHTTFGKVVTKTTVINAQGGYPGFSVSFVRTLCRFIPFDSLSFLFSDRGGWHDRFSNTGVVEDKYVD